MWVCNMQRATRPFFGRPGLLGGDRPVAGGLRWGIGVMVFGIALVFMVPPFSDARMDTN